MNWERSCLFLVSIATLCLCAERVPDFEVSNSELTSLVNQLRDEDFNKAGRKQVVVDYQGYISTTSLGDNAKNKFFKYVDPQLLEKPTFQKLIALNDNFERETGTSEEDTLQEKAEVDAFLDTIMSTKVWETLYSFLHRKGHPYATSEKVFRQWILQLWFYKYSRYRGVPDSSGFEHVFIGEVKNNEVSGLHNWVRFYLLEQDGSEMLDYKGYLIKRYVYFTNVMAALKYSWKKEIKRTGSFLIGTSPEFDMALYTLCFLSRRGRHTCQVEVDGCPLQITSHDLIQRGKVYIGSVFPAAGRMTELCRINGRR
ncbi:unnamed protein product [Enterobius vermicularis]|uniref:Endoribonuclease n=1 Tax=Enterobius vermicularis TaxID=51028 RepID=A0A0N4V0F3_ENTVE|nr:unnamed protein product [Enterobius vermicularis]